MHAISEPKLRYWRPHAPTASSGVPEMLSTPAIAPVTRSLVCQSACGPVRPNGVSDTCTSAGLALDEIGVVEAELGEPTGALGLDDEIGVRRQAAVAAAPGSVVRSSVTRCLPPSYHQSRSRPARGRGRRPASAGPRTAPVTTCATDAPVSASILPANRPVSSVSSITRRPASGPLGMLFPLCAATGGRPRDRRIRSIAPVRPRR